MINSHMANRVKTKVWQDFYNVPRPLTDAILLQIEEKVQRFSFVGVDI